MSQETTESVLKAIEDQKEVHDAIREQQEVIEAIPGSSDQADLQAVKTWDDGGPDFGDGHNWEGFQDGCSRFGCGPNCSPSNVGDPNGAPEKPQIGDAREGLTPDQAQRAVVFLGKFAATPDQLKRAIEHDSDLALTKFVAQKLCNGVNDFIREVFEWLYNQGRLRVDLSGDFYKFISSFSSVNAWKTQQHGDFERFSLDEDRWVCILNVESGYQNWIELIKGEKVELQDLKVEQDPRPERGFMKFFPPKAAVNFVPLEETKETSGIGCEIKRID